MPNLTYGFMDPARNSGANSQLYKGLCECGVEGFRREGVCDLWLYRDPSVDWNERFSSSNGPGVQAGELRDNFYQSVGERKTTVQLPEIQGYFVAAFIGGVNLLAQTLESGKRELPFANYLGGKLDIHGPKWVYDAVIEELHSVMDVFCDFQDKIIAPLGKAKNIDYRLLADAIAGSFFWALLGGVQWFTEVITEFVQSKPFALKLDKADSIVRCKIKRNFVHLNSHDLHNISTFAQRVHLVREE